MGYDSTTVTVTWLDGKQETYTCYGARVREGVLFLIERVHSGQPGRRIPLDNVRIWTEE